MGGRTRREKGSFLSLSRCFRVRRDAFPWLQETGCTRLFRPLPLLRVSEERWCLPSLWPSAPSASPPAGVGRRRRSTHRGAGPGRPGVPRALGTALLLTNAGNHRWMRHPKLRRRHHHGLRRRLPHLPWQTLRQLGRPRPSRQDPRRSRTDPRPHSGVGLDNDGPRVLLAVTRVSSDRASVTVAHRRRRPSGSRR